MRAYAKLSVIALSMAVFHLSGCVPIAIEPELTPLEIQSLQTREYENPREIVFNSVVSVLQDLGYNIKSADVTTGFVNAESAARQDATWIPLVGIVSDVEQTADIAFTQTAATAFIEKVGEITRVRLNFVEITRTSGEYGQSGRHDTPVLDAEVYRNAFERIENAIFVRG